MEPINSYYSPSLILTHRMGTAYQSFSSHFPFRVSTDLSHIPKPWIIAAAGLIFFAILGAALWIWEKYNKNSSNSKASSSSNNKSDSLPSTPPRSSPISHYPATNNEEISKSAPISVVNSGSVTSSQESLKDATIDPTTIVGQPEKTYSSASEKNHKLSDDQNFSTTEGVDDDETFEEASSDLNVTEWSPEVVEEMKAVPAVYLPPKTLSVSLDPPPSHQQSLINLFLKFLSSPGVKLNDNFVHELSKLFAPDRIRDLKSEASKTMLTYACQAVILTNNIGISMFNDLPIRLGQNIEIKIDEESTMRTLTFLQGAPCAEMQIGRGWASVKTNVTVKKLSYDSSLQTLGVETDSWSVNTTLAPFLPVPLQDIQAALSKGHLIVQ